MKALFKTSPKQLLGLVFMFFCAGTIHGQTIVQKKAAVEILDTVKQSDIKAFVEAAADFSYPLGTERLYKRNGYKPLWFSSLTPRQFWDAMMLLDCSIQYGLNRNDYHSDDLTYTNVKNMVSNNDPKLAARLDVLLTDAMLAFISHLHYGKLASFYTAATTDQSDFRGFRADSLLTNALAGSHFIETIERAQPQSSEYRSLQNMLKLMTGQYTGDSYQTSIEIVRLIAVNMERMRWEKSGNNTFVSINIPAFNLRYNLGGEYTEFKVIVGKPSTPTPVLSSSIGYFTTAPDWTVPQKILIKELLPMALKHPGYLDNNNFRIYDKKGHTVGTDPINLSHIKANIADYIVKQSPGCDNALGQIAFNFPNNYNVYLHDTPDKDLFNQSERAFSHGCIRLQNPVVFAELLLKEDQTSEKTFSDFHLAMEKSRHKRFTLKTPVPILVRYITCEVLDGILVSYKDLYKKDKDQCEKLLGSDDFFIADIKEFIRKKADGFGTGISPVAQK